MKYGIWLALPLLCTTLPGCMSRETGQKSISSISGARMSHDQIRSQVMQLTGYSARLIAETGNTIAAGTEDPAVRRNSLLWRIYASAELQSAGMRVNPVLALVETWALSTQMTQLFERDGEELFGEQHALALETAHRIQGEVEGLVEVAVNADAVARGRVTIAEYASEYPVENLHFGRWGNPGEQYLSFLGSSNRGALASVATMEDRVTHLTMALPEMAKISGDIARWQAELVVLDFMGSVEVEDSLAQLRGLGQMARDMDELAIEQRQLATADLVAAVDGQRAALTEAINEQRVAVTESIDAQRRQIQALVTAERIAALEEIDDQRIETIGVLQQERQRVLDSVDQTVAEALATIPGEVQGGVDAFWIRALQVGIPILALLGVGAFLALRYLIDRARPTQV